MWEEMEGERKILHVYIIQSDCLAYQSRGLATACMLSNNQVM